MASDADERPGPGPFSAGLGFELVETGEGGVVMHAMPGPDHVNGGGILHGGYLAALLDSTTGWAVHSALKAGSAAPHTHVSIQYLRAGVEGTLLVCTGRCVHAGRRVAAAEAEITQDGVILARATSSHTVLGAG